MTPPQSSEPIIPPILKPAVVTALPAVALDLAGRIAVDVACRKCGYNLRALHPNGQCPECGTAADLAMRSDLLRFCDPVWVRSLASGMTWSAATVAAALIYLIAALTLSIGWRKSVWGHEFFFIAIEVLGLIGLWQVTMPDPSGIGETARPPYRQLARVMAMAQLAISAIGWLLTGSLAILIAPISLLSIIVGAALNFTFLSHIRRLSFRIPQEALVRSSRIVIGGMLCSYVARIVTSIVWMLPKSGAAVGLGILAVITNALGWLLWIVFSVWALILMLRFRTEFKASAEIARKTWAAQPPTAIPRTSGI